MQLLVSVLVLLCRHSKRATPFRTILTHVRLITIDDAISTRRLETQSPPQTVGVGYAELRYRQPRWSIAKGVMFGFGAESPQHLNVLVDSPETPGLGHSETMKEDFWGFVPLGDATEADGAVVPAPLRSGGGDHVAALDLGQLFQQREWCISRAGTMQRADANRAEVVFWTSGPLLVCSGHATADSCNCGREGVAWAACAQSTRGTDAAVP
jgi:hypothetical protein